MNWFQKFSGVILAERAQNKILVLFMFFIVILTAILTYQSSSSFIRFLGSINPLFVIILSVVLGFLILHFLRFKGWFSIYKKNNLKKSLKYIWLVILFTSIAIYIDLKVPFPKDTHILFPESVLFYPVIAFFVEIVFHVLPLAFLLVLSTSFFKNVAFQKHLWVSIVIVALLEPSYQTINMASSPTWAVFIIFINLFLFNLTQLIVFKKYDFITMYFFRLLYYMIWHVIWGYFRLDFLF